MNDTKVSLTVFERNRQIAYRILRRAPRLGERVNIAGTTFQVYGLEREDPRHTPQIPALRVHVEPVE